MTPEGTKRTPCDICCVIDISGSMGTEVDMKDANGSTEKSGLSILDIVKHAIKTIINNLNEEDRLSIISFHSTASRITGLEFMNEKGRRKAEEELDKLYP